MRRAGPSTMAGAGDRARSTTSRRRWPPRARSRRQGCTRRTAGCWTPPRRSSTRARRCRRAARARVRVGGPPGRVQCGPCGRAVPATHGGECGRRSGAASGVAVVVPADALPARRAGAAGDDRRDVRDGVHLGPVRCVARGRHDGRDGGDQGGGRRRHGDVPVHPRLPGRSRAVLRRVRAAAGGGARSRSGTRSRPPCRTPSRRTAPRSPTTTRSAGTTAVVRPATPGSVRARRAGRKGALDPAGILNPGVLVPEQPTRGA